MTTATPAIRLLLVDDHPLMREGVIAIVQRQSDMQVVGEAASGAEAVECYAALRPDVTLMDLQMPGMDGMKAVRTIRSNWPDARILVLTTYQGDAQAWLALKAGAAGYMVKTALRATLIDAVRKVHAGGRWVAPEVVQELANHAGDEMLTLRELEVLQRVAAGHSNREIGAMLSVTEDTIKARLKTILAKLGARDRTLAVTIPIRRGLIQS